MIPVTASALRRDRKSMIAWWVGVAALVAITIAFYPTVADNEELDRIWEDFPESLQALFGATDLTSPVGYLESQLFAATLPIVLFVWGIGRATDAVAGEEQQGTLDLSLATPITRRSFALQKLLALGALLAILLTAVVLPVLVLKTPVDLDIGMTNLIARTVLLGLLVFVFAAVGYAVSAGTGRKGVAVGVTAGVAVAAYLLDSLGQVVDWLEPFRVLSPFSWSTEGDPLSSGFDLTGTAALVGTSLVLIALGTWLFGRRDLKA